ncbi:MAG: adenine deaminase C-terminal domain-containing protein [Candidatus Methylomirabilales bacterium]
MAKTVAAEGGITGPADLIVRGGTLLNVYSGELLGGWGVAVQGERICAMGPDLDHIVGPETEILDAKDKYLIPGLVEGHTHLDNVQSLHEFLHVAIPQGLTTVITELVHAANVGGAAAFRAFLAGLEELPILVYTTAPSISLLCSDRGDGQPVIGAAEVADLLEHPLVLGLGEIYWHRAVKSPPELIPLIEKAHFLRKQVEGHGAGARGWKLQQFVGLGIGSCHEPITAEEVVERIRLGLHTMVREGSVRQDLGALREVILSGVDLRRLILVTDTVWPDDLLSRGSMDHAVRRVIEVGLDPVWAVRAATLNCAEHFGLDHLVGGIGPGKYANLLVVPDLRRIEPELVISRGRVVAREGKSLVEIKANPRLWEALPRPDLPQRLTPEDLKVPADRLGGWTKVRVVGIAGPILTREISLSLPVEERAVIAEPQRDVLKAAVFDRQGLGQRTVGFVTGFGLRHGAVASSLSFDVSNLVALGVADPDIALALNRLVEIGGGFVVAADGAVVEELPMPIGGIISEEPVPILAEKMGRIKRAVKDLGSTLPDPLLTLQALTFTAIPALRLRERGLLQVKTGQIVPLLVDVP